LGDFYLIKIQPKSPLEEVLKGLIEMKRYQYLWVSFLLAKQFSSLDDLLENREFHLIFSQELLTEFMEVINRPKLRKSLLPASHFLLFRW